MKKISIATFCNNFWHVNFGQSLQCYAIYKVCEKMGNEVKVIRYREKEKRDFIKFKFPFRFLNEMYENYCQRRFIENGYNIRTRFFQKFIKDNVNLTKPCYSKKDVENATKNSDILICGSDQVWNPANFNDIYTLNFGNKNQKRISYAASGIIKDTSVFLEKYKKLGKILDKFYKVSVRESSGKDILSKYTNNRIEEVLDPTLLLSKDEWDKVSKKYEISESYILCYSLQGIRSYKMLLRNLMKQHNARKIVYIEANVPQINGCNEFIKVSDIGPAEFLYLIKNAKAVYTDSFHGIAFSIIYEKQFYTFSNKFNQTFSYNDRKNDILRKLNIGSRECYTISDIEKLSKIDYKEVIKVLNKEKERSINFLINSINEK